MFSKVFFSMGKIWVNPILLKTLWEKEKIQITSIFHPFSHNAFHPIKEIMQHVRHTLKLSTNAFNFVHDKVSRHKFAVLWQAEVMKQVSDRHVRIPFFSIFLTLSQTSPGFYVSAVQVF